MSRTTLRVAAVTAAAVPVLLSAAAPAAADSYFSRTTGVAATTQWVQYLDFDNPAFGNWHVGQLYAYETSEGRADVFSFIDDYECVPGAVPQTDGHGGTPGCTFTGQRQLTGEGLAFTVSRRQASASLTGQLTATAGDPHTPEGPTNLGQVPADFTWTAVDSAVRTTSTYRYRDSDGTSYSDTFRSTSRRAAMSGRLGPMRFEDAASSEGSIESFSASSRSRS